MGLAIVETMIDPCRGRTAKDRDFHLTSRDIARKLVELDLKHQGEQ